jgi:hypothetical protein
LRILLLTSVQKTKRGIGKHKKSAYWAQGGQA